MIELEGLRQAVAETNEITLKARAFAIAVAIVLVVGAFFVRREVIEDDCGGDSGGGRADELVCATELGEVCTDVCRRATRPST